MILTDDQVSLYGDNLASTTATMAPPGCGLLQPIGVGFFSDTDPIVTMHVMYVWGMRKEGMCLGPQHHPGSRGPCYDPKPWKL